jgi:hypothetical protein
LCNVEAVGTYKAHRPSKHFLLIGNRLRLIGNRLRLIGNRLRLIGNSSLILETLLRKCFCNNIEGVR